MVLNYPSVPLALINYTYLIIAVEKNVRLLITQPSTMAHIHSMVNDGKRIIFEVLEDKTISMILNNPSNINNSSSGYGQFVYHD